MRTSASPRSRVDADPGFQRLDVLDESLLAVRRMFEQAGYRRRLLENLSRPIDLAVLRLLWAVQRAEDAPSIGAMAAVLAVDPSTASRIVDRAVDAGLLARRACAEDRRKARLYLTSAGRGVLTEVTARRRELLREVTDDWDADDVDRLIDLLLRVKVGFERLERLR